MKTLFGAATLLLLCGTILADTGSTTAEKPLEKKWYDRFSLRGYAQLRYNRIGETNRDLISDQGDKSIGNNNAFFLRRARLTFSGDAGEYVSFYLQPDFATSPSAGLLNFVQIRDLYADIYFDKTRELRLRAGQSKVPFGFENLQSSQNRLPLDRADAVNSGVKDERDTGLFLYWAPTAVRARFKHLVESGLKGTGDYGVAGLGVYNGQTANRPEANNQLHSVARVTYPFDLPLDQIVEVSLQAYRGKFIVTRGTGVGGADEFDDWRGAASVVLYAQPIGLEIETVVGEGPRLNAAQNAVENGSVEGTSVLASYRFASTLAGVVIPYARWQYYLGGKKHDTNAPNNRVYETEIGVEWSPIPAVELTLAYTIAERTSAKAPYVTQNGRLVRGQLQWNF